MKQMIKTRDTFIDQIKGFLIVLVVLGHVVQVNYSNFDQNIIFRFIYSFHMPLFMAVSGYVAYISYKEQSLGKQLYKKFIGLVVPFLSWYFIYGFVFESRYTRVNLSTYLSDIIKSPDNGLWFLWILFLCFVVLFAVKGILKLLNLKSGFYEYIFLIGVILIIYYINTRVPSVLGSGLLSKHFPSFIFGYFIAKNRTFFIRIFSRLYRVCFFVAPVLLFFWSRVDIPSFFKYLTFIVKRNPQLSLDIYNYLTAFAISVVVIGILKSITSTKAKNLLSFLGAHTLDLYIIENPLLGYFSFATLIQGNIDILQISLITMSCALIIFTSLQIGKIIRTNKWAKFIFFGEKSIEVNNKTE